MAASKRKPAKNSLKNIKPFWFLVVFAIGGYLLLRAIHAQTPAYAPQPSRNGITIGSNRGEYDRSGQPLSTKEYDYIATNYGMVHFPHDGVFSISANQHKGARELVKRNSSIKVFAYLNTEIWFRGNDWSPAQFKDAWLLRDNDGSLVPDDPECTTLGKCNFILDLANPEYRQWAHDVAVSWMGAAPYAGVKFDHADYIGDTNDPNSADTKRWTRKLCPAGLPVAGHSPAQDCPRIQAYNAGITDLITRTNNTFNSMGKLVMFNGIAPGPNRVDRDASYFNFTDGGMDETFCLDGQGKPTISVPNDIAFITQRPNKYFVLHSTYFTDDNKVYGPYCFGAFMMLWQPGYTYWRFGSGYGVAQLTYQLPDKDINLGLPVGTYQVKGNIYSRTFEHGIVYLNIGGTPSTLSIAADVQRHENGKAQETIKKGGTFTLRAQSAAFFLYNKDTPGSGGGTIDGGDSTPENTPELNQTTNHGSSTVYSSDNLGMRNLASVTDIPELIAHRITHPAEVLSDLLHPSQIAKSYYQSPNKWAFWLLQLIYLLILGIIITPVIFLFDKLGWLNPLKYTFGRLRTKLGIS